ncbi:MAG: ankyrin repeat domain-containing protein [Candidatus Hydrogenedentes bacterium]|nr:ankyrin repeat domain-containing protein [Candidatus Hydrogenedentota bacterium]
MENPWIYTMDQSGETPATRARKSGYTVLAEMLLSQERARQDKEVLRSSSPPVDGEAYWGMSHTVRRLVSDKPTPRAPVSEIDLLLQEATREGDVARAKALIGSGAQVNAISEEGLTPLHWSALNGRADIAELLLEHGADINARERYTGKLTPMAIALLMGYDDLVEIMAARGGVC